MASQAPVFIQNENLPIHRGKGVEGVKVQVPKRDKTKKQDRKALRDLSKDGKPSAGGISKGFLLKKRPTVQKPTVQEHESTKTAPKVSILTDEEMKKCEEWAKEGIEGAHFTGNDQQKLEREQQEERIRKKVDKALSGLQEWTDEFCLGLGSCGKLMTGDMEDDFKLELMPEVLPPSWSDLHDLGSDEIDDLLLESDLFPPLHYNFELKLKEDYDVSTYCF